ncbi:hypothetical protein [Achromobacter sp. AONIH1]|jgi:hypothetical protein|uniref:hypothetical protein n=1 Tax=Achromobacter sp. AONIH1 TaxID=1758194 RepID=UPI0018F826DC|nr:hypothetical protein [Achromobacter sp. AONIH1]
MNLPLILRHALRLGAALTLSVSLAACGSDKDDDKADPGNPPVTPQPPAKPELRCAP